MCTAQKVLFPFLCRYYIFLSSIIKEWLHSITKETTTVNSLSECQQISKDKMKKIVFCIKKKLHWLSSSKQKAKKKKITDMGSSFTAFIYETIHIFNRYFSDCTSENKWRIKSFIFPGLFSVHFDLFNFLHDCHNIIIYPIICSTINRQNDKAKNKNKIVYCSATENLVNNGVCL